MTLTWPVVMAVLFGALLHAAWNGLVKSSGDKPLDTALVHGLGALIALPFALWVGLPSPAAWPFIAVSLVIHIGYYFALAGAYQHGELGLTYPIMRGFAPLLVALGSVAVVGEAPSALSLAGRGGHHGRRCAGGPGAPGPGAAPPQGARIRLRQRRDHRALHLRRWPGRAHRGARRRLRVALCAVAVCAGRHRVPDAGLAAARRGRTRRHRGLRAPALAPGRAGRHGLDHAPTRSRCGP